METYLIELDLDNCSAHESLNLDVQFLDRHRSFRLVVDPLRGLKIKILNFSIISTQKCQKLNIYLLDIVQERLILFLIISAVGM